MMMKIDESFPFLASHVFDEFVRSFPDTRRLSTGFPVVDGWREDDDKLGVVEYALAGYSADQLDIQLKGNELVVSADVNETTKGRRIVRKSFSHSVTIPNDLDATRLNATYENGILRIEIPQKEEAKPKSFPIEVRKQIK
jgi:HSP20 family molecular chaperone IbpA